ncbi:hypothetical protein C1H46_031568 [Malus baccata]|uniref:F-box domain-containing protein n=1 Tax=Malus baccata TaxID=106549 RepID=A0A540L8U9_MALBA|nr:hypothetical protein C1H46_031568 [Malus baccata]
MAKSSNLTDDMVVQILSRLPPKSLMRFKCVHKLWYDLIDSPSFVASHLSNSNLKSKSDSSTSIVVKHTVKNVEDDRKHVLLSLLNVCKDVSDDDDRVEDLGAVYPLLSISSPNFEIAGYCDGIFCLSLHLCPEDIALVNPAIMEFQFLPKSCLLLPPPQPDVADGVDTITNAIGFGYDSKAETYKAVRIVKFLPGPRKAEVYTLGADSWREVKFEIDCSVIWTPSFYFYFKGVFYWFATDLHNNDFILTFDMVWNESIALFCYCKDEGTGLSIFDIWEMDDSTDGVKSRWSKKRLTIDSVPSIEIPLVFWKNDELLLTATDGCVVSYNIRTQKLKDLPIHGIENPLYIQAVLYAESLVSVRGGLQPLAIDPNRSTGRKEYVGDIA